MSKWTGKSDFYDWCEMHYSPEEIVKIADICMGNARVRIENTKDLIPYYTNLIASAGCSKDSQRVRLSEESYIDDEEKTHISIMVYDAIKLARKAKKEKKTFNLKYCETQKKFWPSETDVWWKIIEIINGNSNIIKIHLPHDFREVHTFIHNYVIPTYFSNVHDAMHTREREEFIKFCSENGYMAFSWNFKSGEVGFQNQGIHHPLIWNMCWKITEYHKMKKEFENNGCTRN